MVLCLNLFTFLDCIHNVIDRPCLRQNKIKIIGHNRIQYYCVCFVIYPIFVNVSPRVGLNIH